MSNCDAAIRPFSDDTEVRCVGAHDERTPHVGTLSDYAYPGSTSTVSWQEGDRRNFHGDWPGPCAKTTGCILPNQHGGRCAT